MNFAQAIEFAQAHEVPWTRDPQAEPARFGVHHEDPAPWNRLSGPVHPRGGVSGVVWQHGKEIQHWGTPDRADQTFDVLMGSDVAPRKKFIQTHAKSVQNLDI